MNAITGTQRQRYIDALAGVRVGTLQHSLLHALETAKRPVSFCPKCMVEPHNGLSCGNCGTAVVSLEPNE